jgi:polysaccharide deacetylase 2 family uncharacterized protein YibQ
MSAHPPPVAQLRRSNLISQRLPVAEALSLDTEARGASATDAFAQDDVVVDRPRAPLAQFERERLALVVGLCGNSIAKESGFLHLGSPVAIVVDPGAPEAAAFSQIVREAGDALFVQAGAPPSPARLTLLHRLLGAFDGIAGRNATGMAAALRGTGLAFFDERGDSANDLDFATAHVSLIRRDVTADDRASAGYVTFMLERAAALSRRTGPVVIFARPLPATLHALQTFATSRNVQMVVLQVR